MFSDLRWISGCMSAQRAIQQMQVHEVNLRPSQLTKSNWINGPTFLWQEIADWKETTREVPALAENDPEVEGVVSLATVINSSFPPYWKDCPISLTGNVLRRLWHCVCGTCVALKLRLKLKLDTIYVGIRSVQGKLRSNLFRSKNSVKLSL